MSYNWEKIFKSKSDKELYKIITGKTLLGGDAKHFAQKELNIRGFDLNNIEKHKKKWELESLIKEHDTKNNSFFFQRNSFQFLITGIIAIITLIVLTLDFFLGFSDFSAQQEQKLFYAFTVLFLLGMAIISLWQYKVISKKEIKQKSRIKELINEL